MDPPTVVCVVVLLVVSARVPMALPQRTAELEAVLAPRAGVGAMGGNGVYPKPTVAITPQLLRVGSASLASLPFECLSEIALRLKAHDPNTALVSVAGGYDVRLRPCVSYLASIAR